MHSQELIKALISEKAEEAGELVLDASDLEFVSSMGLNALIDIKNKTGKEIKIINASTKIADDFRLTGADEIFTLD